MCLQFTFIHVLFAVLCFWSGFIAGAATNLIISVIAMGITLVMFQLAWSYTETGEVRLTKNMINKRFESFSLVGRAVLCFTFPILAGLLFRSSKNIFNAIVITMDIGLFFLNFYIAMREIIRTNASEKIIHRKENDIYGDDTKPDEANSGNCEK